MRKFITWLLIALLALPCVAFAESAATAATGRTESASAEKTERFCMKNTSLCA